MKNRRPFRKPASDPARRRAGAELSPPPEGFTLLGRGGVMAPGIPPNRPHRLAEARTVLRTRIALPAAWAALLVSGGRLGAQQVELQVREEATRAPVAGAIVRLLGDRGIAAQGLTNEQGRIVLRAGTGGPYRIKVDRIGWSGLITAPVTLTAGAVHREELLMASTRIALPTLEVRGRSRCAREGQGGALAAALWDEIGKALTANLVTHRQGLPLHVRGFVREADLRGVVQRQWVESSTIGAGHPFATLPPALLIESGFVQQDAWDSVTYAAPDAALLLSEAFVETHCFRAVPGDSGLLGLAFEPTGDREVTDVRGTLWVHRETSELRFLEFRYTGLPALLRKAELGGRVEFRRLPGGAWMVSDWHVRTPSLIESEQRTRGNVQRSAARLVGYLDKGGRAEVATDLKGRVDRALVVGTVYDSLRETGLAGAVIRIKGITDSVLTDGAGSFSLAVPASGDQVLVVSHPRGFLLSQGTTRPILLSLGDTSRVMLTVPSLATMVRSACGAPVRGRSALLGIAWNGDGMPGAGFEARVRWSFGRESTKEERRDIGASGLFAFCALPPDQTLSIRLMDRVRALAERMVQLEWGAPQWVELVPGGVTLIGPRPPPDS
jgi:hypothetical protein